MRLGDGRGLTLAIRRGPAIVCGSKLGSVGVFSSRGGTGGALLFVSTRRVQPLRRKMGYGAEVHSSTSVGAIVSTQIPAAVFLFSYSLPIGSKAGGLQGELAVFCPAASSGSPDVGQSCNANCRVCSIHPNMHTCNFRTRHRARSCSMGSHFRSESRQSLRPKPSQGHFDVLSSPSHTGPLPVVDLPRLLLVRSPSDPSLRTLRGA